MATLKFTKKVSNPLEVSSNLFYVGDKSFESEILKSEKPVIVNFWAAWCGPCRAIAPSYERLSDEYNGKLRFAKMDIDENQVIANRLRIQALPALIIFHEGKEIGRLVGPRPDRLKLEIDRILVENGIL